MYGSKNRESYGSQNGKSYGSQNRELYGSQNKHWLHLNMYLFLLNPFLAFFLSIIP